MLLYLSYRRNDRERVARIANALEQNGAKVWWDQLIVPGDAYERQLSANMKAADVVLVFISRNSASALQQREEVLVAKKSGKRVIPVRLDDVEPAQVAFISGLAWLDVSALDDPVEIARRIQGHLGSEKTEPQARVKIPIDDYEKIKQLALLVRDGRDNPQPTANSAHRVFLVHGHDDEMMADVAAFLRSHKVEPVILKKLDTEHRTLFEKFEVIGGQAKFAIVLVTCDDMGGSLLDYEHPKGGEKTLQFRARQNVVLELGFFFGKLGWDNVFILQKSATTPFPRFEMPSDLNGVMFNAYREGDAWKGKLLEQLKAKDLA